MNDMIRPGYERLVLYATEEPQFRIKLDANERAFNLPDRVAEAVKENIGKLAFNRYPDIGTKDLRQMLADSYHLGTDEVLLGNGSSEILAVVCRTFGGSGRPIAFMYPSFSMYETYVMLADSPAVKVPLEKDFSLDIDTLLSLSQAAKLIILCNPNNPTGNAMGLKDIEKILDAVSCPVVVDEAYCEFFGPTAVALLTKYQNLMVVRTFSKAYGLAAARVGYVLGSAALMAKVGAVMLPYHVNSLSLAAAQTVWQMKNEFTASIEQTIDEREKLFDALKNFKKLTVYPSKANFILFSLAPDSFMKAATLKGALAQRGIGIRGFSLPEISQCLRVTVGTPRENRLFIEALTSILANQ